MDSRFRGNDGEIAGMTGKCGNDGEMTMDSRFRGNDGEMTLTPLQANQT